MWSRISHEPQTSSSESSLSEESAQGKHPSYKECVTLPRVLRSTGLVQKAFGSGYVLFSNGTFDLMIEQVELNPTMEVRQAYYCP
jgi:hypothetical protein